MSEPYHRRAFLAGTGAAALTLAAGVPAAASTVEFDPANVFDELHAAGLRIRWCRPVGRDRGSPFYFIAPARGGFSQAHIDVMTRWADTLEACPIRAARMEAFLADFEDRTARGV